MEAKEKLKKTPTDVRESGVIFHTNHRSSPLTGKNVSFRLK